MISMCARCGRAKHRSKICPGALPLQGSCAEPECTDYARKRSKFCRRHGNAHSVRKNRTRKTEEKRKEYLEACAAMIERLGGLKRVARVVELSQPELSIFRTRAWRIRTKRA